MHHNWPYQEEKVDQAVKAKLVDSLTQNHCFPDGPTSSLILSIPCRDADLTTLQVCRSLGNHEDFFGSECECPPHLFLLGKPGSCNSTHKRSHTMFEMGFFQEAQHLTICP